MTEASTPNYSAALERFAQDFETDTAGYLSQGGSISLEASGTNGLVSAAAFRMRASLIPMQAVCSPASEVIAALTILGS